MTNRNFIILLFVLIALPSCNVTKGLSENELLITKTEIDFKNPEHLDNEKEVEQQLLGVINPQATSSKVNLAAFIYQWGEKSTKEKGLRKWIQRNFGTAPAIYSVQLQSRNRLRMKKLLKDNGFFRSDIVMDTLVQGKTVELTYNVLTHGQYKLGQVKFPNDSMNISQLIHSDKSPSRLKSGDFYSEVTLAAERTRLSNLASKDGYVDFDPNYVYYFVDTIPGELIANIYVKIKSPESSVDHLQYTIGKTTIYPNYDLSNQIIGSDFDTLRYNESIAIIEDYHLIDHKVLDRMILQNEGQVISKRYQDASVSHLLDLGIFKFVNLKYERLIDSTSAIIHRNYFLTPNFNQTVSANFELNNRTGGFFGVGALANYRHLNVLKKAIVFNGSISGGLETQIGNNLSFINTSDLNIEASLAVPRFITPYRVKATSGLFLPRTTMTVGNNFQRRTALYSINSTNLKFGYQWKENSEKEHTFNPLSINRVQVLNTTSEFDALLLATPRLNNSFQNLLIAGLEYTYVYTNQSASRKKDTWYFRGNLRTSGNLAQIGAKAFNVQTNSDGQFIVFGLPFAEFTSLEFDLRFFKKINYLSADNPGSTLAFRFSPAVGFAYGNSDVLPYIEQFFVGGANSLRAFRIRSIGPGLFARAQTTSEGIAQSFIDQTGDVKLEMSAEYRFPIFSYLKGAAFVDAGNVWLLNDTNNPTDKFSFDTFWKEIAIGAGLGLRIDIDYIVLRMDVALPIRKSYFGEGFQWTLDRFAFENKEWRGENIIYNLAVGYPF